MKSEDPKITAVEFSGRITGHVAVALSAMMSEDHLFVDREGSEERSKAHVPRSWRKFFWMFHKYQNTMVSVESRNDTAIMIRTRVGMKKRVATRPFGLPRLMTIMSLNGGFITIPRKTGTDL